MGSDCCSIFRFSWLGHQSRFDLAPTAVCVNGHFASVDICSLLWSVGRRHPLRADAGRLPVSRHRPQLLFRREPGAVRPSPPPRQQARHPPLIHRLALAADARSAQRILRGGDGLRRGRREGRLQRWGYPAHDSEKLLAAVRAKIGHTVGRSRIMHHLTPSFCAGGGPPLASQPSRRALGPRGPSSGTDLTHPMDRQGVRRDDVALLREGTQIDRSNWAQEQVDHSTASLADEMIVLAGLGIESDSLCVQKEGADLTLVDETVKVAINGGETGPRQLFVNPLVDLMGERVSMIPLESFEHLLQLACRTFAGGPPHRLTSKSWIPGGSDRTVSGRGYQIDGFLSSDSPGDPVSSGGVEREELGPLVGTGQPALSPFDGLRSCPSVSSVNARSPAGCHR